MKKNTKELLSLLGEACYKMYQRLNDFISDHYNVDQSWQDGGKYGDTVLRYQRNGKTLCTFYFRSHQLGIWIILGKEERTKFENLKTSFSRTVRDQYDHTPPLHDGKWLTFDVSNDTLFDDILLLLSIKKTPNRKLTRCGSCCDLCKAFSKNLKKQDQRQQFSAYFQQYYHINIPAEYVKCDGCLCEDAGAHRLDTDCPIRPCVLQKQLEDCSWCKSYPCEKFMSRKGLSFEEANEIKEIDLPSYYEYLCTFDNQSRLDRKRKQ